MSNNITTKTRQTRHRAKLRAAGGRQILVTLSADDLNRLAAYRAEIGATCDQEAIRRALMLAT
ncbi:MAG: hypothetical protein WC710_13395 [Gallionella sp.]